MVRQARRGTEGRNQENCSRLARSSFCSTNSLPHPLPQQQLHSYLEATAESHRRGSAASVTQGGSIVLLWQSKMRASPPGSAAMPPPPPSHPPPFINPGQTFYMSQCQAGAPSATPYVSAGTTSTMLNSTSAPATINGQQPQPAYSQAFLAHTSAFLPMTQPPMQALAPAHYPFNSGQSPLLDQPSYYQQPSFLPPPGVPAPASAATQPFIAASTFVQPPAPQFPAQSVSKSPISSSTPIAQAKRWPTSQDATLLAAVTEHGQNWDAVAASVNKAGGPARTAMGCKQRYWRIKHPITSSMTSSPTTASASSSSSSFAPLAPLGNGTPATSTFAVAGSLTHTDASSWPTLAAYPPPQHLYHQHQQQHQNQQHPQQQHIPQASMPLAVPPPTQFNQPWSAEEDATLISLAQKSTKRRNLCSAFRLAHPNTTRTDSAIFNRWYKFDGPVRQHHPESQQSHQAQQQPETVPPSSPAPPPGDRDSWSKQEEETLKALYQTIKGNPAALYTAYCKAFPGTTRTAAAVQVRSSIVMRRSREENSKVGRAKATTSSNNKATSSVEAASSFQDVGPSLPTVHRQPASNTTAEVASTSGPSTSQTAPRAKRQAKQPQRDPRIISLRSP